MKKKKNERYKVKVHGSKNIHPKRSYFADGSRLQFSCGPLKIKILLQRFLQQNQENWVSPSDFLHTTSTNGNVHLCQDVDISSHDSYWFFLNLPLSLILIQLRRFALRFIQSHRGATGVCWLKFRVVYFRLGTKMTVAKSTFAQ